MQGMSTRPLIEEMLITEPRSAATMCGNASCANGNGATRFRSRVRRMASSGSCSAPGALQGLFAGGVSDGFTHREVVSVKDYPEFIQKKARLALMDAQGVEAAIMLPTLGVHQRRRAFYWMNSG